MAVEQGIVKYYRNGALLYTSTQAPTYPLVMDTALFHVGAQIKDAVLYAGSGPGGSLSMPAYTAYYSFGGKLVGMRRANYPSANSNGQFRIVGDHLGSTTLIVDTATPPNVVQRQYSKPYGETAWQYTAQSTGGRSLTNVGYTGQRSDEDSTGLMFYNARMYDPALSAFVSADTIAAIKGDPRSRNRYSYVLNNPLGYADPTGHCQKEAQDHADRERCDTAVGNLRHFGFSFNPDDWTIEQLEAMIESINDFLTRAAGLAAFDYEGFKDLMNLGVGDMITLINPDKLSQSERGQMLYKCAESPACAIDDHTLYVSPTLMQDRFREGGGKEATYKDWFKWSFIHEMAHILDDRNGSAYSSGLARARITTTTLPYLGKVPWPEKGVSSTADENKYEAWAETVASIVYPGKQVYRDAGTGLANGDYSAAPLAKRYVRQVLRGPSCLNGPC